MEPFHAFLTIRCDACKELLIRFAQSQFNDLAVCPRCFAAGPYDEVVEEGISLESGYNFPQSVKEHLRHLHANRPV